VSDLARQYPPGSELAKVTALAKPAVNGQELDHSGNSGLGHDYKDDRTK
jgi:hypothetical protein